MSEQFEEVEEKVSYSDEKSPRKKDVSFLSKGSGNIMLPCRSCLKSFAPVAFINHVCDISTLVPCNKCRQNFLTKEDLDKHVAEAHKRGRKRRQFTCIHCDVAFEDPESLEYHLLTVGRQSKRIYNCDFCTKFYTDENDCEEHMIMEHTMKTN